MKAPQQLKPLLENIKSQTHKLTQMTMTDIDVSLGAGLIQVHKY
jgi:hypothetical protein